ncbi:hypothetical protein POTOM_012762 [Populus tomentosa]|uniref:Uncharacterized protein n=1 Tax=Populus tomentosa TaxID=118781 RepID=A0A8X8A7M3_POPTO|nr:hypothetical protein POTOM_012762 [Populus tomentosa]
MSKENIGIVKAWEAKVRKSQPTKKKNKNNSVFLTMMSAAVAHVDDDDPPCTEPVNHAEKILSNGDFYTGQWLDNLPHGHGKYLWTDGCMYLGEWYKGKTMGKGKFSWPSGATYEGEFKGGYVDGRGTYTGSSCDTFRGYWVMNLKHGNGTQSYANGDYYDGDWRRGSQDGHGRYQWKSSNHYIGQWKNGLMNGSGTMIWSNGNRYDGFWQDGLPTGNGSFRWPDGSFYVGFWSKDPKEQNGTYYPSGSVSENLDWDPQELFLDLNDCKIATCEKMSILPSQMMLSWPGILDQGNAKPVKRNGNEGRLRRISVDGRLSNYTVASLDSCDVSSGCGDGELRDVEEGFGNLQVEELDPKIYKLRTQPVKKQGETISKGHKNYELMLNLQLGIRHSVGRPAPAISLDLKSSAFDPKEKVWTKFPPEGSKHTPPHQSSEFKWKDYCPVVFRSELETSSCREALTPSRTSGVRTPTGIRTPTGVRTPTGLHTPTGIGDESESGAPRLSRADLDKLFMDPSRWASIKLGINMPARVEKTVRKRDFEAQLIGEPTGVLKVTVLTIYLATGNELSQPQPGSVLTIRIAFDPSPSYLLI